MHLTGDPERVHLSSASCREGKPTDGIQIRHILQRHPSPDLPPGQRGGVRLPGHARRQAAGSCPCSSAPHPILAARPDTTASGR
jgi:hypothetical protein